MDDLNNGGTPAESARRSFLKKAGIGAAGLLGAGLLSKEAHAQRGSIDPLVLNFALNLEYLEGEYYNYAVTGQSITAQGVGIDGSGTQGNVIIKANPAVPFATPAIRSYAEEIAADERNHVSFLRAALAGGQVARPTIDLQNSFIALGNLIGVSNFDPFADENSFLLGAFIFEDVGVTAYKGAARLLANKDILEAAAGLLGVEAYHAGEIRTLLASRGFFSQAQAISDVRDSLDGPTDDDQGIGTSSTNLNIVPTDSNSLVYSRTTTQVLNIVYGNTSTTPGLFFPNGMNGAIR